MMEDLMERVAGLRFEVKGAETDSRVTKTGVNRDGEEAAGNMPQRQSGSPPSHQIW